MFGLWFGILSPTDNFFDLLVFNVSSVLEQAFVVLSVLISAKCFFGIWAETLLQITAKTQQPDCNILSLTIKIW